MQTEKNDSDQSVPQHGLNKLFQERFYYHDCYELKELSIADLRWQTHTLLRQIYYIQSVKGGL